jgi:hypothetical protein
MRTDHFPRPHASTAQVRWTFVYPPQHTTSTTGTTRATTINNNNPSPHHHHHHIDTSTRVYHRRRSGFRHHYIDTSPVSRTTCITQGDENRGRTTQKTAQETLTMSLGLIVCFLLLFTFHFSLLTMFLGVYRHLLATTTTTTPWPTTLLNRRTTR